MTPEEWEKVTEIFHAASEMDVEDRIAFLKRECDGDEIVRKEVESLLAAEGEAGDFISQPVVGSFASDILNTNSPSPNDLFGHYRIVSKIGSGGMGEVFLAIDTKLGREVAIKTLSSAFDDEPAFLKRFQNEAGRTAATLNHPNVATVYSVDEHDGRPFIAMEYIHGKTLDKLIPTTGMEFPRFIDLFSPIVDAIAHAHSKGVVHRDIKPGNIMIGTDGTPKVLDFGLAYFQAHSANNTGSQTEITQPGQILGTPAYMSPEQAEGKDVDHRSDIFSLGVVMYQSITGRRPFAGDSHAEIVSNLLKSEPEPIAKVRPETPEVISGVVGKCLRKPIAERYQLMDEVSDAFGVLSMSGRSSRSFESFQRRLFRESSPPSLKWIPVAAVAVVVAAVLGWYYFSSGRSKPPINFATMTMRRLSDTDNVGFSMVSPDGRSVAFATFDEDQGTRTLWIRRIDDRNALQIVPPQRMSYWGGLAVSDDGGQVYYLTAGLTAAHGTLYRVSSLGGPPRKLIDTANDVGGISPDGQRILFVRYSEPSEIISASTTDGSGEQVIKSAPIEKPGMQVNFRDPQFSPDGRSVYYIQTERIDGVENWSLNAVPLDGGPETAILRQKERIGEIAVLRDGSGLLVTAVDPVSNLQQIFHVSIPDGQKTRITNDLFYYFGVSVDRDGRSIVASQRYDEQQVWIGEANNLQNLKPLGKDPNAHRNVEWTHDGRIVYDAYENNLPHIWTADADGKNLQRLTGLESSDSEPRISGDGRYIVFTSTRAGFNQVYRMDIDGGDQVLLANVNGMTQTPRFAADGQTVVFEWLRERDRVLGKVPITGGNVEQMTDFEEVAMFSPYFWAMSPDGKNLAYSFWDKAEGRTRVAIRPVESPKPTNILNIWPTLIFKWMPDSKSIYYRERQLGDQPESEIRKVDIATGKSTVLTSAVPEYIVDLTYSHDGKRVGLVRGRNNSNSVMLTAALEK